MALVEDPISSALALGKSFIDKFFTSPADKAAAAQKLMEMQLNGDLAVITAQAKINEIEAGNVNMFVAGWRPFIGWVCGIGLAWAVFLGPLTYWLCIVFGHPVPPVQFDVSLLTSMLVGMLGLGGMRTVEKLSNAQSNH